MACDGTVVHDSPIVAVSKLLLDLTKYLYDSSGGLICEVLHFETSRSTPTVLYDEIRASGSSSAVTSR
jgi:hypothetical protein